MSIEAMTAVLNHSKATGRAKLVLIGIANHQGDQGSWPSIETLARYANASERSVIRDIQELEELGELIVERNAAPIRGQYRPNLYWVNVSGVTNLTPGVTNQVSRGDSVVTLNINNPKENQEETIPQAELEDAFEKFWEIYPRKVEKLAAKRALASAMKREKLEVILDGAQRYATDPNLPSNKQYIAHPTTWLNGGRWDDEPLPERELTKEELEARQAEERKRKDEARRRAEEEQRRLMREAQEKAKANPPKLCIHDRVALICPVCSS